MTVDHRRNKDLLQT